MVKSSKYPGYPIEVGFNKDPYSWLPSYEVTDNYQAIRFESDMISLVDGAAQKVFTNEKYRLGEYEYILTDYPVCATLDEYMKHASAILSLVVYYDLNVPIRQTISDRCWKMKFRTEVVIYGCMYILKLTTPILIKCLMIRWEILSFMKSMTRWLFWIADGERGVLQNREHFNQYDTPQIVYRSTQRRIKR